MKTIYYNGHIYTGELPLVEAFIVEDGRFTFAGSSAKALALCVEGDEKVDLEGQFVCAGFNDSHMHLLSYGNQLHMIQMNTCTDSLEHLIQASLDFLKEHPAKPGEWIYGRGWNHDYFTDVKRLPNRHDLDRISTENPVCATRCCGHVLAVNTKALEVLGITKDTVCPAGGQIGMDADGPDGLFFDNAMNLVSDVKPLPDKDTLKQYILAACKELNRYGVTSSQTDDYCVFRKIPWQLVNEAYRELEAEGLLTVRVCQQCNFETLEQLQDFVETGWKVDKPTPLYKLGPLKMLGDGSLGARTAFLSRPYADAPDTKGLPVFTAKQFNEMIGYANEQGMAVAIHAIGDACLDDVLSAIEKALGENPREDHRHGIVHCQITREDQLEKMAKLNLHIFAQSIFLDYDVQIVEDRVGKELAATSYAWKTLMDKGLSVSNGTDCPVEMPNALGGIQCVVTRKNLSGSLGPYLPKEAFSVKEAIDSYTIRSAEGSFEENEKGLIKPGYLADFVVLGENLFEVPEEKISQVEVREVYTGGKRVR